MKGRSPLKRQPVRARRQRRRRALVHAIETAIGLGLSGLLCYAFWTYLAESPRFQVRNIRIEGARLVAPESLRAAACITAQDNVLFFDSAAVEQRLEAMPMIRDCTVLRAYPDMVVIQVVERIPLATLLVDNHLYTLDADGMVLAELGAAALPVGPFITNVAGLGAVRVGEQITHPAVHAALAVWQAFSGVSMATEVAVSELAARADNEILMYCDELPFEIRWGRSGVAQQAARLDVLWRKKERQLACLEYLDLRFDNNLVCR